MPLTPKEQDKFRKLDALLDRKRPMAGGPCGSPPRASRAYLWFLGIAFLGALIVILKS